MHIETILSYQCSNKKHSQRHFLKSQGATHRQQLPINTQKCQIGLLKVNFLSFLLVNSKLLPNPEHLLALTQLPLPSNKDQLRSFLGSLRHYDGFCPNFSSIACPLYFLLKCDVHWKWSPLHLKAFHDLLAAISKGLLTCYNISKPLFIMSDASGLGFVLSHDADQREIIWMESCVLTMAEANYSNIECEALAIVETVKYFHQFLAGRHFVIRLDHAPLKFIFNLKKNARRVSCQLQCWVISLMAYDYTIQYIKGDDMFLADTFS